MQNDENKIIKKKKSFFKIEFKKMTKKEKDTFKKIYKLNKVTKVFGILFIVLILFMIINNIIMYFNESYAYFYVKNITNFKNGLLYFIFGHIKYSNFVVPGLIFIIMFIFSFISDNRKLNIKKRNNAFNVLICIFLFFIYSFSFQMILENQYFLHLPNFDNLLFSDTKDKTYTTEQLITLNNYLKDKVIEYASISLRDTDGNVILNEDYNEIVINDLQNVSDIISLLKGLYPTKSNPLDDKLKGLYGSSTVGLTTMYTTYFDYEVSPVIALNTITHEYCHTKGITRENETVFCAFLAGANSNNVISNYAAYLEAFTRSNYALSYIDSKSAYDMENDIISLCLTQGYSELCEMYVKNNNSYIPGVEELIISSYKLSNYKNFKSELFNSLTILENNGASFTVEGKNVTLNDIVSLVNSESDKYLRISLEIDSNKFDKIKDAIKNDRLYISIYQNDWDEEEPPEIENPIEFFLSPFPNNDEGLYVKREYAYETYTYERSARLFLEYFDKYGYN